MTRNRYARRTIVRGLGVGAGLLPLLDAGRARADSYPRRVLFVTWTNGTIAEQFWPQGSGDDLSALRFPTITASLAEHRSDLLFIDNMELKHACDTISGTGTGHGGYPVIFRGARAPVMGADNIFHTPTPSIDQVIADAVAKKADLPVRSLHLGVLCGGTALGQTCSYRDGGLPVAPERNPSRAAGRLFSGSVTGGTDFARIRAERSSMLDLSAPRIERFARNLGTADRQQIEAHLASVRDLERQLAKLANPTTACKDGPIVPQLDESANAANFSAVANAQSNIVVSAFKCDLTRVATLQLGDWNSDNPAWYAPPKIGRYWHAISHEPGDSGNPNPGNSDLHVRFDAWFMQQHVAELIRKFKAIPEGGGTMLDNTVILFANPMSDGKAHDGGNLPWFLAGKCGGYFGTGRFLHNRAHTPTTKLLVGVAEAMGVPLPDQTFGDPQYGGLMAGLGG